ncbi:pentatricopeptide repeat-containing protein [Tanacetum coccineum]
MQASGDQPDLVTIVSALSACANLRALGLGLWLHRIVLEGNMLMDNHVQMQSRILEFNYCGLCFKWKSEESLKYLYWMQQDGLKPDGVTFTGALTACSHAGLVDEGLKLFDLMIKDYRISPRIEHYGCLAGLAASNMRRRMKNRGIEKNPGVGSIEIDGIVYQVVAGDQSHVKSDSIYKMLDNLSHELMISGYLPEVNVREQYE